MSGESSLSNVRIFTACMISKIFRTYRTFRTNFSRIVRKIPDFYLTLYDNVPQKRPASLENTTFSYLPVICWSFSRFFRNNFICEAFFDPPPLRSCTNRLHKSSVSDLHQLQAVLFGQIHRDQLIRPVIPDRIEHSCPFFRLFVSWLLQSVR